MYVIVITSRWFYTVFTFETIVHFVAKMADCVTEKVLSHLAYMALITNRHGFSTIMKK